MVKKESEITSEINDVNEDPDQVEIFYFVGVHELFEEKKSNSWVC